MNIEFEEKIATDPKLLDMTEEFNFISKLKLNDSETESESNEEDTFQDDSADRFKIQPKTKTVMTNEIRQFEKVNRLVQQKRAEAKGDVPKTSEIDKKKGTYVKECKKIKKRRSGDSERSRSPRVPSTKFDNNNKKQIRVHEAATKFYDNFMKNVKEAENKAALIAFMDKLELCDGYLHLMDNDKCTCCQGRKF